MGASVKCGGRRESGKCGEQGFGIGVTHWHAGRNCAADSSADRKAVRIAKGYLRFITEGVPGRRAGRDEERRHSRVRTTAGQVGAGSWCAGPAPLNGA